MARIVFDLDGTLIDSAPDIHAIACSVLELAGAPPITLEQARSFVGEGAAVFVRRMRDATGIPESEQERLLAAFMARYAGAVELTDPYPGVIDALEHLIAAAHVLGVCTNKPLRPARGVIAHLGLSRFFSVIVGGDSLPVRKPDPAPLDATFAVMGPGPELFVGDSETDAETARRAAVPLVLFTEGYRKAPVDSLPQVARFDRFETLPALVATLLEDAP